MKFEVLKAVIVKVTTEELCHADGDNEFGLNAVDQLLQTIHLRFMCYVTQ